MAYLYWLFLDFVFLCDLLTPFGLTKGACLFGCFLGFWKANPLFEILFGFKGVFKVLAAVFSLS